MGLAYNQHLLVVEHRYKCKTLLSQRIWCDQDIDLVAIQGLNSTELKFLDDVQINFRPRLQERRCNLQQPLVAGMTLHANSQRAAFTTSEVLELLFGSFKLRQ